MRKDVVEGTLWTFPKNVPNWGVLEPPVLSRTKATGAPFGIRCGIEVVIVCVYAPVVAVTPDNTLYAVRLLIAVPPDAKEIVILFVGKFVLVDTSVDTLLT
jgi:hypothetical protein